MPKKTKSIRPGQLVAAVVMLTSAAVAGAQTPAGPIVEDARSHLKAGLDDPGTAIRNLELVTSVPSPPGFYDPMANPLPPGFDTMSDKKPEPGAPTFGSPRDNSKGGPAKYANPDRMVFANTDLAFAGDRLITGGFHGFNVYNIADHDHPRLEFSVVCPGGQGDVSIYGNLVFVSVEQNLARVDCGTSGTHMPEQVKQVGKDGSKGESHYIVDKDRFKGVRIFDISDPHNPRQVAAVQTCRGSHTHTIIPDPHDARVLYVYVSGIAPIRPAAELAGCSDGEPKDNPDTSDYSIDVVKVPLDAPQDAAVVSHPRIFSDPVTGAIDGLWKLGNHGPGTQRSWTTDRCHDITFFPSLGLGAGACAGNGLLLDVSKPAEPVRIDAAIDPNFIFWHSAIFSNDGSKVVFTDEWSSGVAPRCRQTDPANWGGDLILDIVNRKLIPRAYYKIPTALGPTVNCVAHNGGIIPVPGRDIFAQGWYSGGVSVVDFTDSAHPKEIAYFDRGPLSATDVMMAGNWTAYWYRGRLYSSEIARGLDIFKLEPSSFLTRNEIAAAELVKQEQYNPQSQPSIEWPDVPVVARAYLDQLLRAKTISPSRAAAVTAALDQMERGRATSASLAKLAAVLHQRATMAADQRNARRFAGIARILRSYARPKAS
jgi:hypothetical protein